MSPRAPRDRAPLAPCHGAANDAVIELATRRTLAEAVAGLAIQLRFRPDETPDVRIAGIPAAGTAADEARSLPETDVARGAAEDVTLAGGLRGGGCFCGPAVRRCARKRTVVCGWNCQSAFWQARPQYGILHLAQTAPFSRGG